MLKYEVCTQDWRGRKQYLGIRGSFQKLQQMTENTKDNVTIRGEGCNISQYNFQFSIFKEIV